MQEKEAKKISECINSLEVARIMMSSALEKKDSESFDLWKGDYNAAAKTLEDMGITVGYVGTPAHRVQA